MNETQHTDARIAAELQTIYDMCAQKGRVDECSMSVRVWIQHAINRIQFPRVGDCVRIKTDASIFAKKDEIAVIVAETLTDDGVRIYTVKNENFHTIFYADDFEVVQ